MHALKKLLPPSRIGYLFLKGYVYYVYLHAVNY